jgi:hypothetical protein
MTSDLYPTATVDTSLPRPSRRRLISFWIIAVLFLFLLLGEFLMEMPGYFLVPVTVWGGWGFSAEMTHHSVHTFMVSLTLWAAVAGVAFQTRRPQQQIGAAYTYAIVGFVTLAAMLALGAVPSEAVPILLGAMVFAVITFVVHPSPLAAKIRRLAKPSVVLGGLVLVAAVPLLIFAFGSSAFAAWFASGPGDEHYDFGHWAFMGIYPIVTILLAAVATMKVSGWRVPGWTAAVFVFGHGLVSLVVPSASALGTIWALLAMAWGIAFAAAVEMEARKPALGTDAVIEPAVG